ncbi:HNH endonuclease signature motif containing protein [Streptomyces caniferus]|uniref:HNH endonuclease signature motif containing protein n=1 Tax=Streptomyces caniferus TaxID=285557 RepID=UPI0039A25B0C
MRRAVDKAGHGYCERCGVPWPANALYVDHRLALANGGQDVASNLQLLDGECHRLKTREDRALFGR